MARRYPPFPFGLPPSPKLRWMDQARTASGRVGPRDIEHVSMSESEALAAMVANAILIQDVW